MRYLSICSGIEAATVAWSPLGWTPVAFAEIEPFPCAVLQRHYPTVPNWGDLLRFKEWPDATVDVLVGGTPCQSFSVAGLRAGLDDPRGSLLLVYLAIALRYRPEWVVWENVPGALSVDEGRAFGSLLGGLAELGYGFAYRVLDAQYFGLAQRRARVFVVGHLGNWRRAAAVLVEHESLSGHPAPSRPSGEGVTSSPGGIAGSCSRKWSKGTGGPAGDECYNLIAAPELAKAVRTPTGGIDREDMHALIAHSLRADGFDASEDGTGRGIIPLMAFRPTAGTHSVEATKECAPSLKVGSGLGIPSPPAIMRGMQVRRLTPRECERLQGFSDDYTLITYRGKPAADGPRYKALGNSMAVPVMRWIGERIALVDAIREGEPCG